MDGPALEQASSDDRCSTGFNSDGSQIFPVLDILVVSAAGSQAIDAVFRQPDVGYLCLAQPGGRLHKCVEHRLQIERPAADDLENIGGGGLLLKRLVPLARVSRATFVSPRAADELRG